MSDVTVGKVEQLTGGCPKYHIDETSIAHAKAAFKRIAALETYLRDLLADIDHAWATRAVPGLKYIEMQFTRGETEELRKLIGGKG